jgi:hypothetical protein
LDERYLLALMPEIKDNENKHGIYQSFVRRQLFTLDTLLMKYQDQLNVTATLFHGYTLHIQQTIETYIEEHLRSFRMKIEHHIELIHYDYHIQALKLDYLRHHPTQFQVNVLPIYIEYLLTVIYN